MIPPDAKEIPINPKYAVDPRGDVWNVRSGKKLRPWACINACGRTYFKVDLGGKNSPRAKFVHRLVLMAFQGPPNPGDHACHLNDDPGDNRAENLIWASQSTNERHKRFSPCVCGHEMANHHDTLGYCAGQGCRCLDYSAARKAKSA